MRSRTRYRNRATSRLAHRPRHWISIPTLTLIAPKALILKRWAHSMMIAWVKTISHFFWRSVSCCGPHRPIQWSHPHQWGQGVSCGYLIRRWLLLLGLSLHHSPMASPYGLESLFAILEWIVSSDIALFSPMILACRGEGRPRQYNLVVWIPFIRPRALLPPRRGPWAWYQMGQSLQILWPHTHTHIYIYKIIII